VIAEIGINHEGDVNKALRMIEDAAAAGCECVKLQTHVIGDEMIPNDVVPGNADESIWEIMRRCSLTAEEEARLKQATERQGMIFLSTPFSRAAADRLNGLGVSAFKIGSGECNNYPLVKHIAGFRKPILLSTGMNDLASISPAVEILREAGVPFCLLHCTSIYPTPHSRVRLGALACLGEEFPDGVLGLSDHSLGIYTCLAAVALGARVLEKHFTSEKSWPGPDIELSLDPVELRELVKGARAVFDALGGAKDVLPDEQPTIAFAYASVVSIRDIAAGEILSGDNIWVKRPGTGEISARDYEKLLGRRALSGIPRDRQLRRRDVEW
jgi:N-acetylneuraminate synthase